MVWHIRPSSIFLLFLFVFWCYLYLWWDIKKLHEGWRKSLFQLYESRLWNSNLWFLVIHYMRTDCRISILIVHWMEAGNIITYSYPIFVVHYMGNSCIFLETSAVFSYESISSLFGFRSNKSIIWNHVELIFVFWLGFWLRQAHKATLIQIYRHFLNPSFLLVFLPNLSHPFLLFFFTFFLFILS